MSKDLSEIRDRFANYTDEELRRIIYLESEEYESGIIEIAKEELYGRYEKNIWESTATTLKDIIIYADQEQLEKILNESFDVPYDALEKYAVAFNILRTIEPMYNSGIYISLEVKGIDMHSSEAVWKVVGEEQGSEEKISLQYCNWNEWMGFLIKNEQLQMLGKEKYVACCLMEMTVNGFDEETINNSFFVTMENIDEVLLDTELKPSDLAPGDNQVTFDKIAERGPEVIKAYMEGDECSQIRPWVRYWARSIDGIIWGSSISLLLPMMVASTAPNAQKIMWIIVLTAISVVSGLFIEALLLSSWGYTPGKWLLKTSVRDGNGDKLKLKAAFYRAFSVLIFGQGLDLPLVSLVTNLMSYTRLTERGKTSWDEKGGFVVSHKKIGIVRIVVTVFIIIAYSFIKQHFSN